MKSLSSAALLLFTACSTPERAPSPAPAPAAAPAAASASSASAPATVPLVAAQPAAPAPVATAPVPVATAPVPVSAPAGAEAAEEKPAGSEPAARKKARAEEPAAWTQAELERVSEEIKRDVEKLRGLEFKRPVAVELADKQGFLAYARKRQEVAMTPGRVERDERVAKMLGLIPPDIDLMAAYEDLLDDQVGGFYDPSSDTFFLMESFTGGIAKVILAHELTHALDDQHFDIDGTLARLDEETDAELAFQAVVEGSGTSAMNQWAVGHLRELGLEALAGASSMGTEGLADAPPYMWKPLLAVYLRGEGFLTRTAGINAGKAARAADVRRAFEAPPRSTEQILHPEKYWDEERRDEPRRVAFARDLDLAGWEVVGEDTLGELFLALLTMPLDERGGLDAANPFAILKIEYTDDAAEGWGGDRLVLLEKDGAFCLDLVTVWDRPEDAREFEAAVRATLKDSTHASEIVLDEATASVEIRVCDAGTPAEVRPPKLAWTIEPVAGDAGSEAEAPR